jgi:hypothetical protein
LDYGGSYVDFGITLVVDSNPCWKIELIMVKDNDRKMLDIDLAIVIVI